MNTRTALTFGSLFLVLGLSFLFYTYSRRLVGSPTMKIVVAEPEKKKAEGQPPLVKETMPKTKQAGPPVLRWGRDPFLTPEEIGGANRPTEVGGPTVPSPSRLSQDLRSIIIGGGKAVAIIGGQAVGVGEKVGEEVVLEIREGEVVLARGEERRVLKLREPSISVEVRGERKRSR